MSELILDKDHRYFFGECRLPSVTQILAALGLADYSAPWFTEEARLKGQIFHECCELINKGTLDWDSVDSQILGEVEAYSEWKDVTGFQVEFSEKRMHSETYNYAGTLDMSGHFPLEKGFEDVLIKKPVIIDLKRGASTAAVDFQTAAYTLLYCEIQREEKIYPFQVRRFSLEKFSGGKKPKMIEHKKRSDLEVFKSILSVFNAGFNKGIYKLD